MRLLRNILDLVGGLILTAIVYKIARGPSGGMTAYQRGYFVGSMRATQIHGEAIADARARGLIRT